MVSFHGIEILAHLWNFSNSSKNTERELSAAAARHKWSVEHKSDKKIARLTDHSITDRKNYITPLSSTKKNIGILRGQSMAVVVLY